MIRAVSGTNLLVSFLLTHRLASGHVATLIDRHLAGEEFVLVTAPALLEELGQVLGYPQLQRYYLENNVVEQASGLPACASRRLAVQGAHFHSSRRPAGHGDYSEAERKRFVALILALAEVVDLSEEIPRIGRDPEDDRVIASAVAGGAGLIVGGDRDLLALERVGRIPILSARQFLDLLEQGD